MSNAPFRVLSLDGGGIRGLFSTAFLAHIEEHSGKSFSDYFDLIVGTSTGSIIALGLAAGLSASQLLGFYKEHGPRIFAQPVRFGLLGNLFRSKYSNERLTQAMQAILGEKTLNELRVPVCVPSYELVEGCPRVFKDNHHPHLHWGGNLPVWKVAAASSAAPIYFPAFQIGEADSHIDGGIWANNPVLVGITEAIRYFDQSLENIAVLSVGTGSQAFRMERRESRSLGILGWGKPPVRILNVVLDAQSSAAHNMAALLLKPDQYVRIDADLSESIPLDSYTDAVALIERGQQAGRKNKNTVERQFLNTPRTQAREEAS